MPLQTIPYYSQPNEAIHFGSQPVSTEMPLPKFELDQSTYFRLKNDFDNATDVPKMVRNFLDHLFTETELASSSVSWGSSRLKLDTTKTNYIKECCYVKSGPSQNNFTGTPSRPVLTQSARVRQVPID